jgi:hypothetical protein
MVNAQIAAATTEDLVQCMAVLVLCLLIPRLVTWLRWEQAKVSLGDCLWRDVRNDQIH